MGINSDNQGTNLPILSVVTRNNDAGNIRCKNIDSSRLASILLPDNNLVLSGRLTVVKTKYFLSVSKNHGNCHSMSLELPVGVSLSS